MHTHQVGRSSAQLYEGADFAPKFRAPVRALKEPVRGRGGEDRKAPHYFPPIAHAMSRKIKILVISNPLSDWSMNTNRCLASRDARSALRAGARAGCSLTSRRLTTAMWPWSALVVMSPMIARKKIA